LTQKYLAIAQEYINNNKIASTEAMKANKDILIKYLGYVTAIELSGKSAMPFEEFLKLLKPFASGGIGNVAMGGVGGAASMVAYKYASGGLADFTGPAWLDGTPSKPEYILNASQTERFFSLVDVLESFDPKEKGGSSGDNYFDIEINVEKIDNDYDVEQIANKIRGLIYEDATYRNVNAVNLIR
jgi:hypothetical protein